MGVATATVRNHIQTIHEKLRVGGKAELIAQLNLADRAAARAASPRFPELLISPARPKSKEE